MSTSKVVELKSSDEMIFEVELAVAMEMQKIRDKLDDDDDAAAVTIIPVPTVTSKILAKVIEYCKRHVQAPKSSDDDLKSSDEDLKSFNSDFVKVDQETLLDLFVAANDLRIDSLLDLTTQTVENMMKGKTTAELITEIFKIKNDFTP